MGFVLPAVAFVIPLPHPSRVHTWDALIACLEQTIASIENQSDRSWTAVIVTDPQVALPDLPNGWMVERMDVPLSQPECQPDKAASHPRDDRAERVRVGVTSVRECQFTMIVEPGDFVHRDLVAFIRTDDDGAGRKLNRGYLWSEGSRFLFETRELSAHGASYQIVRTSFYDPGGEVREGQPVANPSIYVDAAGVAAEHDRRGTPLRTLPFAGVVHRVSTHGGRLGELGSDQARRRRPAALLRHALGLRLLTRTMKDQFGMEAAGSSDVVAGMHPATRTVDLG